jgi:hypothetical protein
MGKISQLITIQEMRERIQRRDDSFDLTIEKWVRIRKFLETANTLSDFQELLQGAAVAVPFCFEYQIKGCFGCPLEKICAQGRSERFLRVMRLIQAYTIAGDMLPKEKLASEIDDFIMELQMIRAKHKGMIH